MTRLWAWLVDRFRAAPDDTEDELAEPWPWLLDPYDNDSDTEGSAR